MQKRKIHPDPIVANQLYDDEELLWQGWPKPTGLIGQLDIGGLIGGILPVAFGIGFIIFTQNMFNNSIGDGPPPFFRLFFLLIPLVFVGIGLREIGKAIIKFIKVNNTTYALTTKRALIIVTQPTLEVRSYYDENIRALEVTQNLDGTGNVIFSSRTETRWVSSGNRSVQRDYKVDEGYFGIHDAREVEDLMSQIFFDEDKQEKPKKAKAKSPSARQSKTQTVLPDDGYNDQFTITPPNPAPPRVKQPTKAQLEDRFGSADPRFRAGRRPSEPESASLHPTDVSLTPYLVTELHNIYITETGPDEAAPNISPELLKKKLVRQYETGAGERYTVVEVTDLGKEVLKAYGREV